MIAEYFYVQQQHTMARKWFRKTCLWVFYVHDYRCVIHGCEKECRERHAVGFARQTCKVWTPLCLCILPTPRKLQKNHRSSWMQCNAHNKFILWQLGHTQWGFPEINFIIVGAVAKACCPEHFQLFSHLPYD